jgi:3-hydroxymyristoyl/3-hydroxydecanoyl-(acyl carrier protein) dehydratase
VVSRRLTVAGRGAFIGILSEEGLRALRRGGHGAAAALCAPDLAADAVRFVDLSEREALEAAPDARLAALYDAPFPARPFVRGTPAAEGPEATIELRIQPDLACLRGHFPRLPVVPGATQLGWALEFGSLVLGTPRATRALHLVKFERIIQPGRSIRLRVAAEAGGTVLRFEYASGAGRHSTGRIETSDDDG